MHNEVWTGADDVALLSRPTAHSPSPTAFALDWPEIVGPRAMRTEADRVPSVRGSLRPLPATRHAPRDVSIVVPTRNEAGNVRELVRQVAALRIAGRAEIIFVDDSTDETPAVIAELAPVGGLEIILIHRSEQERAGGLGGAVVRGLQIARAPWVCVMDGDLQHPPELIPTMLTTAGERAADGIEVDLVLASRYVGDGDASSFSRVRAMASEGSTLVAKTILADRLRGITDPMSGFFMIRREAVDLGRLKPDGFKILIEIVGRMPGLRVAEVPFTFRERFDGESKASALEAVRLGRILLKHRLGERGIRLAKFAVVGASGIIVNEVMLAVGVHLLALHFMIAAVVATFASIASNFVLAETWVFKAEGDWSERTRRGVMFLAVGAVGLALQAPMLYALAELGGVDLLLANLISLMSLMLLRFVIADRAIWGGAAGPAPRTQVASIPMRGEAS